MFFAMFFSNVLFTCLGNLCILHDLIRGIRGQVLLSSWGKGHRQTVAPVAQQVAVESRKTLEADPFAKEVYLTVQIVHCKCLKTWTF